MSESQVRQAVYEFLDQLSRRLHRPASLAIPAGIQPDDLEAALRETVAKLAAPPAGGDA